VSFGIPTYCWAYHGRDTSYPGPEWSTSIAGRRVFCLVCTQRLTFGNHRPNERSLRIGCVVRMCRSRSDLDTKFVIVCCSGDVV
jgi:hypothetical protein